MHAIQSVFHNSHPPRDSGALFIHHSACPMWLPYKQLNQLTNTYLSQISSEEKQARPCTHTVRKSGPRDHKVHLVPWTEPQHTDFLPFPFQILPSHKEEQLTLTKRQKNSISPYTCNILPWWQVAISNTSSGLKQRCFKQKGKLWRTSVKLAYKAWLVTTLHGRDLTTRHQWLEK